MIFVPLVRLFSDLWRFGQRHSRLALKFWCSTEVSETWCAAASSASRSSRERRGPWPAQGGSAGFPRRKWHQSGSNAFGDVWWHVKKCSIHLISIILLYSIGICLHLVISYTCFFGRCLEGIFVLRWRDLCRIHSARPSVKRRGAAFGSTANGSSFQALLLSTSFQV